MTLDEFSSWLASSATKALLLQLQIDEEELKYNWANGEFLEEGKEPTARGQASYIKELQFVIRGLKQDND